MSKVTFLRVRRVDQQFCAEIDSFFSRPSVCASDPTEALYHLYEHPDTSPWRSQIAKVIAAYNLGFGPVTDAHLAAGISMATFGLDA